VRITDSKAEFEIYVSNPIEKFELHVVNPTAEFELRVVDPIAEFELYFADTLFPLQLVPFKSRIFNTCFLLPNEPNLSRFQNVII
ncbi:hypothetical protein HAX54_011873, partial [Datura stramonium]|nr:hypothetical protein [Datura stramonium]